MIYWLPELEPWCRDACCLSTAGVVELAGLLLQDTTAPESWLPLLRDEPGLAVWAAAGLRWRLDDPPRLDELARWLAERGRIELSLRSEPPANRLAPSAESLDWWTRRAVSVVAIWRVAHRAGASDLAIFGLIGASERRPAWLAAHRNFQLPRQLQQAAEAAGASAALPAIECSRIWGETWRDIAPRWQGGPRQPLPLTDLAGMAERRLRLQTRFSGEVQREKLAALKELAYGASHELNNPLGNIATRAQTLMRDEADPERRRKLGLICAQAFRAHEMISDMMLFAKPPALERRPADLAQLARQVVSDLAEEAELQSTALELQCGGPLDASCDSQQLQEALRSLCRNSLEAVRSGGRVTVRVWETAEHVAIEVADTGPGIPTHVREHLFDPYFSGREAGRGIGLGLSKCWTIVKLHHGEIEWLDDPGGRIQIRLPR